MARIENIDIAQNEANIVRKRAETKKEGEPDREDYENAEKSLTQEIADFIKDGSREFDEISQDIDKKYEKRMEKNASRERLPKRLLILECSGLNYLLGKLVVLSDEKLDSTNTDMLDVTSKTEELPIDFSEISGVIITGSPADIVEKEAKPWIEKMEKFVGEALDKDIPVLGICFGIQAYADLKGREVPKNEGGREMGVWETDMFLTEEEAENPIFKGMNFKEEKNGDKILKRVSLQTLGSHAYHAEFDPKAQAESMHGFRSTEEGYYYPMVEIDGRFTGLQFHPEFSSPEGIAILETLVKKRADKLVIDGKDPSEILEGLEKYKASLSDDKNPDNVKFLKNFIDIAIGEQ